MSTKITNSLERIEIFNFLNDSYFNMLSQINIITINIDKLNDLLLRNKLISLDLMDHINLNKDISLLMQNLKLNFQDYYIKLNEKIKNLDHISIFSEKFNHFSQPSTNEEETSKLNSHYKSIFQNFERLDKLTNDINKIRENKKEKRLVKLKNTELKISEMFGDIVTLNFNQINTKLKNLEVDNLFDS